MTKRKIEAYEGSGNVFADLGLPNPEERLLKSSIITKLHRLIRERDLTQVKAAKLLGISQPDLSRLLRGNYDDYSPERLMEMLTVFEQDIDRDAASPQGRSALVATWKSALMRRQASDVRWRI